MEGRVDEADDDGEVPHRLEDAREVRPLDGEELVERGLPLPVRGGEDHPLDDREPVLLEEHVLRAAEADPLRPERPRPDRVTRVVRVRPHLEPAQFVGP